MAVHEKVKLTIDGQIEDLKNKGVKFDICSEEELKKYLQFQNYYFKFKSFAKNYVINPHNNQYVNLDVAYLMELSSIDLKVRKIILDMCLDIEHFLKVRFLRDICDNSDEDGYNMVRVFMESDSRNKIQLTLTNEASGYSVCRDLAEKYKDCPDKLSVWTVVELLPFGAFVDFYSFYYNELYPRIKRENYSVYLGSIKFLRNAAAHNNALLSSLYKPRAKSKFKSTKELVTSLNTLKEFQVLEHRESMMGNPVVHDFIALMYVYNDLFRVQTLREKRDKRIKELYDFFCGENAVVLKNKVFFKKSKPIIDTYIFVSENIKILYYNMNGKNKGKNILKLQ